MKKRYCPVRSRENYISKWRLKRGAWSLVFGGPRVFRLTTRWIFTSPGHDFDAVPRMSRQSFEKVTVDCLVDKRIELRGLKGQNSCINP